MIMKEYMVPEDTCATFKYLPAVQNMDIRHIKCINNNKYLITWHIIC